MSEEPKPPKPLTPEEIGRLPDTEELKRLRALKSNGGSLTRSSEGISITEYDAERAPSVAEVLRRKIR